MSHKWIFTLTFALLLTSCNSPFAQVVLAPKSAPQIESPAELPESLIDRAILWHGGVLWLNNPSGKIGTPIPEDAFSFLKISSDDRYLVYRSQSVIDSEGLPQIGDDQLIILNLLTGEKRVLVSKAQSFPSAQFFAALSITPDGKDEILLVEWEKTSDLVMVNVESGEIQYLNVAVIITNFGYPEISQTGQIVVICKGLGKNPAPELCLLSKKGKKIRHLTSEEYPWPGYGIFTPDGRFVVYESRYKLYKYDWMVATVNRSHHAAA